MGKDKKKVNGEFRDNGRKIAESYYKVTGKVPLKDHKMSVKVPGSVCYKQWKVRSGCLEKIALGNSRGSSDFPEGRSPGGKSDDPRKFPRANFLDNNPGLST